MGSWDWDRTNGDCLWDEGQYRIFGVDPKHFAVTAENVRALIHPDDWDILRQAVERLFKTPKSHQAEFRVRRSNGEVRWCLGTAAPTVDASGKVVRISGVTVDITDRKESEERQALLAREVDHRAKNALALVQSIIRLTRAGSIANYVEAVEGRIKALSRAHTVLSLSRWQGADLAGLVEEELTPFMTNDPNKVVVQGPKVLLQPTHAQTLALALHELATNAAKYGALSTPAGRVKLIWELKSGNLVFTWSESGGPATELPVSPGFGTRIILASIQGQLGGNVNFDWQKDGLLCSMSVPISDKLGPPETAANGRKGDEKEADADESDLLIAGNRIMIVEDEALVAMAARDLMTELGFSVVGPFSKMSEAISALKEGDIDAAILDVNLSGELVYPLADILATGGVPFIFATGYGAESIDRRFAKIPVLQKPIERRALQRIFLRSEDVELGAARPRANDGPIEITA